MISVAEALAEITSHSRTLESESVELALAAGRVLAQSIFAERDQPPFDRVTMDGAAIRWHQPATTLTVSATQFAGDPPLTLQAVDSAIEIMTGAAMPAGADTVVPVERYQINTDTTPPTLVFEQGYSAERGQFIHQQGSDHRAGATLLRPGMRIGAAELAVIASAGEATVQVARQPRIAVIATGNELVAAGQTIADHQIRLSNGPALIGALKLAGFDQTSLHHLNDDRATLEQRLAVLLAEHDVLILSGGVSKGKADHVPDVLNALGVQKHFHRIAQRPGKPMWFGTAAEGKMVFALPGNPVSTLTCFRRYAIGALAQCSGLQPQSQEIACLSTDWHFKPPLTAFVPVNVASDARGVLVATPVTTNTSGDFSALAGTSGFIELPADRTDFSTGEAYPLFRW